MRESQKIKEEYSTLDNVFPLRGDVAKLLINGRNLTYKEVGEPAGVTAHTISNWINNYTLAPKRKVLIVFGPLGVNEDNLDTLVLKRPGKEVRQKLQKKRDSAIESIKKRQKQESTDSVNNVEILNKLNQVLEKIDEVLEKIDDLMDGIQKASKSHFNNQELIYNNTEEILKELDGSNDDEESDDDE